MMSPKNAAVLVNHFISNSSFLISWSAYDSSIRTDLTSNALLTPEGWWLVDPIHAGHTQVFFVQDVAPGFARGVPPVFSEEDFFEEILKKAPVLGILLTNENHERASYKLSEKMHWPIHAHEIMRGYIEIKPDFFFHDNEKLKGGIEAIHIPGATMAETCFYDSRNRVLMMGDALINLKETGFTFLPDKYCKDPVLAKKSLQCLITREFDILTFSHGYPLRPDAQKRFQELIATMI